MSTRWPWWQQVLGGIPVGVAVALFAAVRWPIDLLVVLALILYVPLMARALRMSQSGLRQFAFMSAFLTVGLFTILVAIVNAMLPANPWLPWWALAITGLLAAVLGVQTVRTG